MMKSIMTIIAISLSVFSFGQSIENEKLIELGKAYKNFMFRNEPPKAFVKDLDSNVPRNLKKTTDFIVQTITTDNQLLKKEYLTLPDNQTLKTIYICCAINYNLRKENQIDNNKLIDSLRIKDVPKNELVDNYYSMSFASIGNKIKPFDFSKINFNLKEYNLCNDTEKGIFFLQCINYCGKAIWGYMNIVKPPNTELAFDFIKKYPQFNGLRYFQFTDLNFPDFKMEISNTRGLESYKSYYIDKYYELLLSHLICLKKQGASESDINDLLLGSILKDRNLYVYTKQKDFLEKIFVLQKKD